MNEVKADIKCSVGLNSENVFVALVTFLLVATAMKQTPEKAMDRMAQIKSTKRAKKKRKGEGMCTYFRFIEKNKWADVGH